MVYSLTRGVRRLVALFLFVLMLIAPQMALASADLAPNYMPSRASHLGILPVEPSDFDGSFKYSIVIEVPPGRNDMQPELSLDYSSNNSKNVNAFGYGWDINIPYIERINKKGTNNLYTEHFFFSTLDGEATTTDSGMTNFGPLIENGDFRTYEWVDNDYWKVKDKEGTIYTFGTASTSQIVHTASSTMVYRWMLEEVRDRNDNYISYEYYKDEGFIYPYKIKYTGNDSTDGIFEVEFLRETRSDVASSSAPGYLIASQKRIDEIQIKVNGSWVRKYDIGYTTGDNGDRSLISSITETGRDENGAITSYPATTVTYHTSTDSWTHDTSWVMPVAFVDYDSTSQSRRDSGARFADFDGDGLIDIAHSINVVATDPVIYFNNGDGTWATTTVTSMDVDFTRQYGDDYGNRVVDYDGDGLADIYRNNGTPKKNIGRGSLFSDDSTFSNPVTFSKCWDYPQGCAWFGATFIELNGDGLPDIIKEYDGNSPQTDDNGVYFNTGSDWIASTTLDIPYALSRIFNSKEGVSNGIRVADMNGDGLDDLVHMQWPSGGDDNKQIYFNNGDGTWTEGSPITSVGSPFVGLYGGDQHVRVVDVNSDGLPDFVKTAASAGNTVYLNTNYGKNFVLDSNWSHMPTGFRCTGPSDCSPVDADGGARFVDINGDGLVDIIKLDENDPSSSGSNGAFLHDGVRPDMIKSITTKLGETITVSYTTTATMTSGGETLNDDLPHNLTVVSHIVRDDGFGTFGTTTYTFEDGYFYYYDEFDRRFAGFATTTEVDPFNNRIKKYFHIGSTTESALGEYHDDLSKIGKEFRQEVRNSSDNLYTTTITRWENVSLSNDRDYVKATTTLTLTYDGDSDHRDIATTFDYDDTNGNLTTKTEYGEVSGNSNGSFTDTGTDKRTTEYTYAASSTLHLIGLPSKETMKDNGGTTIAEKKFYYDGIALGSVSKGNLTKQEELVEGSTYIDIERSYDSTYGLVTQEKDPRDKATTFTYDSYNLHIATSTNPKSQLTHFFYDYSSGQVATTTDANGLTFVSVFDGLDRVIAEKVPDDDTPSTLVLKATRAYTDTVGSRSVLETHYLSAATSSLIYTYLDGHDRPIQSRTEMEKANTYAIIDTLYDKRGDIATTSLPYRGSGTARTTATTNTDIVTTYTYDTLRRPLSMTTATGTESYSYDQWVATTTDREGSVTAHIFDAYGNLARVHEVAGGSTYKTNYDYDTLGNLTKITDALSNIRTFTYDNLGRLTKSEDLHDTADSTFASTTYAYDDAGNLTTRLDQNGDSVTYTYDDINRTLTEDYAGGAGIEVSFGYDWCTNGIGRLCSATTTEVTTTYAYTPQGFTSDEARTIGSTTYTTLFAYDRQGNQTQVTYPDTSLTEYLYNTAGLLEQVLYQEVGTSTYATIVSDYNYHPSGKVEVAAFDNGITSYYTYATTSEYRLETIDTRSYDLFGNDDVYNTHSVDLEADDGDYFSITDANQTGLDITGDFTIEAWVTTEENSGSFGYNPIFAKGMDSEYGYSVAFRDFNGTPRLTITIHDSSGGSEINIDHTLPLNEWKHLAFTYDASEGRGEVFVNGQSIGSDTGLKTSIIDTTHPVKIGMRDPSEKWDGKIDDVRVWNDIRTTSEIADNYQYEVASNEQGLVGYWKFNNNATDTTTGGNNLVPSATPTYTTDVPFTSGTTALRGRVPHDTLFATSASIFERLARTVLDIVLGVPQIAEAKKKGFEIERGQSKDLDAKGWQRDLKIGEEVTVSAKERERLGRKGWNYDSTPIAVDVLGEGEEIKGSQFETTFHGKWINYKTDTGWAEIDTTFTLSDDGACFAVTEAPFTVCAPRHSGGTATMTNTNRWDIFKGEAIDDAPQTMSIAAQGTHNVAGRVVTGTLETARGTQHDVSYVLYEGAYDDADLIYYVDYGRAPRLEKLVRFTHHPKDYTYDFTYTFETPVDIRQQEGKNQWHTFDRGSTTPTLKRDRGFSVQKPSGITRKSQRGFGVKVPYIWDSNDAYQNGIQRRTIQPVDYTVEVHNRLSYTLTKDVEAFFTTVDDVVYPVLTDTSTTFYPDPSTEVTTVDGRVYRSSSTSWSDTRSGTGTGLDELDGTTVAFKGEDVPAGWDIARVFTLFDTSALPDLDTIDAATYTLYYASGNNQSESTHPSDLSMVTVNPASNTTLATGDYTTVGTTTLASDVTLASFVSSGSASFSLNQTGLDAISKTGVTKFGIRPSNDFSDSTVPTARSYVFISMADATGTANDPKLVITHMGSNTDPGVPTDLETERATNPSDISDITPEFTAIFNDVDTGDYLDSYQIQVATSTDYWGAPQWDSTKTAAMASTSPTQRSEEVSYAGPLLATSTSYYWRIRFWDDSGDVGPWSTTTASFSIVANVGDFQDITYDYDRVGNITRIVDESETEAKKTTLFTYDDLHRLKSASTTATTTTPYSRTYSYNALGNITNKSDQGSYTYAETNYANPHAVTDINGTSYTYDNVGNVTNAGSWDYTWDYRNRLTQADNGNATTTYEYDHTNIRTKKVVDMNTTIYPNEYYSVTGATTTKHILLPDGTLVATIEGDGVSTSTNYIHLDHLGGTNVVSNQEGERVQLVDYYPFGEERVDVQETTFDEQRKFTGHEYEEDTDLTYMKARYYGQDTGKFISIDPVVRNLGIDPRTQIVLNDPQLANSYSYARNNPLVLTDPDGEFAVAPVIMTGIKIYGAFSLGYSLGEVFNAEFLFPSIYSSQERSDARFNLGFNAVTSMAGTQATTPFEKVLLTLGSDMLNGFDKLRGAGSPRVNVGPQSYNNPIHNLTGNYSGLGRSLSEAFQTFGSPSSSIQQRYQATQTYNNASGATSNESSLWVTPGGTVTTWFGDVISSAPSSGEDN